MLAKTHMANRERLSPRRLSPRRQSPRRLSLLYYSGTGGTKLVAELLGELLSPVIETRVTGVNDPRAYEVAAGSDFLVFCYPTYFLKPAPSMREFIEGLAPSGPPRASYIVTTYELYPENSIRACALMLGKRGIFFTGGAAIRAPGSDATSVLPAWLCPWLYRFEKDLPRKLGSIAQEILTCVEADEAKGFIPAMKWYSPFAQLLQVLLFNGFEGWRSKIHVLPERCISCGACVRDCDRKAWLMPGKTPEHLPERCELCTRCIHRCPKRAIVLLEGVKDNPRLDARLYAGLEAEARLGLEAVDSAGGQLADEGERAV